MSLAKPPAMEAQDHGTAGVRMHAENLLYHALSKATAWQQ